SRLLDFYRVLNVDPAATTGEIQSAYQNLAGQLLDQPDARPGATPRLAQARLAYTVLTDPARRAAYDLDRLYDLARYPKGGRNGARVSPIARKASADRAIEPSGLTSPVISAIAAAIAIVLVGAAALWLIVYTPGYWALIAALLLGLAVA